MMSAPGGGREYPKSGQEYVLISCASVAGVGGEKVKKFAGIIFWSLSSCSMKRLAPSKTAVTAPLALACSDAWVTLGDREVRRCAAFAAR